MLKRGDKIFLDKEETVQSMVNQYLACRDGVVECYSYRDMSGYGSKTKLYLCQNTKHEHVSIIRQTLNQLDGKWYEEDMMFDSDSFAFLEALLKGKKDELGGKFEVLRDYSLT